MKKFIKHIRIAIASIFYSIGHYIDDTDIEDIRAEFRRLDLKFKE